MTGQFIHSFSFHSFLSSVPQQEFALSYNTAIYCVTASVHLTTVNVNTLQDAHIHTKIAFMESTASLFPRCKHIDHNHIQPTFPPTETITENKYLVIWLNVKFAFKYHVETLVDKYTEAWLVVQKPKQFPSELQRENS